MNLTTYAVIVLFSFQCVMLYSLFRIGEKLEILQKMLVILLIKDMPIEKIKSMIFESENSLEEAWRMYESKQKESQ